MSARFFASIRRNQKQWMVVVTVLSMVSFLFLDDFGRGKGPMSAMGGALTIGSLCAAAMCIIGYQRQKTAEYGIGGFVVGFLAGFIGFGAAGGNKPVVRTAIGSFTRQDLDTAARDRQSINQFIFAVAQKAESNAAPFGGADDDSVVRHLLHLAEAKKMGIQVTDERVNEYLKDLTKSKLDKKEFRECLSTARLGEGEMFELLKSELAAKLVSDLTEPPGYVPPLPPFIVQNLHRFQTPIRYMQETPEQLWETFEKLNLKQSIEAVKLPVSDFISKVEEPSDTELLAFFDKFKSMQWFDEARPGFLQLPRVQLAYLTADFVNFEKGIQPTDAEVQDFYDKNKEKYRVPFGKESTAPKFPDDIELPKPESPKDEDKKIDEEQKGNQPDSKPDASSNKEEKKPGDDESDLKKQDKKDESEEQKQSRNEQQRNELQLVSAVRQAGNSADEEPKAEAAAADKADQKPSEAPESQPNADSNPASAIQPDNLKPSDDAGSSLPMLSNSPEALPAPKYRELNDDLKFEIREAIMRERAFLLIADELDKAMELMDNLRLEYDTLSDVKKKAEKAKSISDDLKVYAVDHKLEYVETPELTQEQLQTEPIGRAVNVRNKQSVADEVFQRDDRGNPHLVLYSPRRADGRALSGAFAYWKIKDVPARVPELKDEGVREKVLAGWKFDQARKLAEQRAKELVAKVQAEKDDLPAALSGESVTGAKSDPPVSVIPTDEFSWITMNQSFPGSGQGPMISTIPLMPEIGNDFMKTVFEDLDEGQVGYASNGPKSVYYVVKVVKRELAKNDDGGVAANEFHQKFLKERFTSPLFPLDRTPYQAFAQMPQQQIDQAWYQRTEQQYRINWDESAIQRMRR